MNDDESARVVDDSSKSASRRFPALDTVVSAAWLYYQQDLTQAEVAKALGVSRSSVVNLLSEARRRGIVSITLDPSYLTALTLAQELRDRFGLRDAVVIPTGSEDDGERTRMVGAAAARYLESVLEDGDILAVSWGVTMLAMAESLKGRVAERITVAQLMGGFSTADVFNPTKVAYLVADKLDAKLYNLYTPAYVTSPEIRDILLQDPAIHSALEVAKSATKAIVGIGVASPDDSIVKGGFISPLRMDELILKGAVGNVISRFFDVEGRLVQSNLDQHLTSLSLDDLRGIPTVIGAGAGANRERAILGALRGKVLNVLITDTETAREILTADTSLASSAVTR
jgi:DNA-binding transcriptional regulator LsrR (DeoR family)